MTYDYKMKLKQAQRTKKALPYLRVVLGTTREPCPVHAKNRNMILPVEHRYWMDFPMRETDDCRCSLLGISKFEYQKLRNEGIQDEPVK